MKLKQASWHLLAVGTSWGGSRHLPRGPDAWFSPDSTSYWLQASLFHPCLLSDVAPSGQACVSTPVLGWNAS